MILSASRRTDIPAFYSTWFCNRLKEGFLLVRNPMNRQMVSRICLDPDLIDGIVFWTKNPAPMLDKLENLNGYSYYFQFTITAYGPDLEPNLPPKEQVITTFNRLSRSLGTQRVIWRYDPILLAGSINEAFHYQRFRNLAQRLQTERCIISFLDMYDKCKRNLAGRNIQAIDQTAMQRIVGNLKEIAHQYRIRLFSCAEPLLFDGLQSASCIDPKLIAAICRYPIPLKKDPNQRKHCLCAQSIDIGAYHSCNHLCLYCYANADAASVLRNAERHDPDSPLLTGKLTGSETITTRKMISYKPTQASLFCL